jgi:hypothetical protein
VDVGGGISYGWGFGPARSGGGGGGTQITIVNGGGPGGGAMAAGFGGGPSDRRFRLEVYASAQNLFNRTNYMSYGNVDGSLMFGRPTSAGTARRAQTGIRLSF